MNEVETPSVLILKTDYQKMIDCLKKIANNDNTMDDTTYCCIAGETLTELGIKYETN